MATAKTDEGLKRVVGVPGLTLNIINFTIGAGIFVLPAIVGIELGSFAVFIVIVCVIYFVMKKLKQKLVVVP